MTEQHPQALHGVQASPAELEPPQPQPDGQRSGPSDPDGKRSHEDRGDAAGRDDEHRSRPVLRMIGAAIVLVTLVVAALVIHDTDVNPRTDDAEVFANFIGIAPRVDGPILQLPVHDNQQVHAGDVLFEIDRRPYQYALERAISDQQQLEGQIVDESRTIRSQESAAVAAAAATRAAQANVTRAGASIDEAKADVANSQAALDRARAEYAYSLNNLHRVEPLLAKQFVTVDQVDQIRTGTAAKGLSVNQAEAELALSKAHLASATAAFAQSLSDVSRSTAQTEQSRHAVTTLEPYVASREGRTAAVRNAQYNLNNCVVHSPFDARVTDMTISEGAYAHTGQQVFTLIDTRVWWVIANFRETQLRHILPGMHVDVYLMSQPGVHYAGIVESTGYGVTPDASTIGSLTQGLPDVQRTLSWVHLASRYPVRIRIKSKAPEVFRIGESAVVIIRGFGAPARY
jgi:multidrug efflux system membrane fusion protein